MQGLYDSFEITIAGRQMFLPRSLEMAKRIEASIGAIDPFARRLEKGLVQFTELHRFYSAMLRHVAEAPTPEALDAWLFEQGVYGHQAAAMFAMSLVVGAETFARESARIAAVAAGSPSKEEGRGPFVSTAA